MTTDAEQRSLLATLDRLAAWLRNPANADGCEPLAMSFAEWCQAVVSARAALTQPAQAGEGGEAVAWLCNWPGQGKETWHHVYINEADAIDRKRNSGGEIVPLYTAPPASQEQAARYLIRARWPDGIEQYLDVNNVTELGGKVGIDVDVPMVHPLTASQEQAQQPSGGEVVGQIVRFMNDIEAVVEFRPHQGSPLKVGDALTPATKPEPMTDEQRSDLVCAVAQIATGEPLRKVAALAVEWTERFYGITSTSTKEPQHG